MSQLVGIYFTIKQIAKHLPVEVSKPWRKRLAYHFTDYICMFRLCCPCPIVKMWYSLKIGTFTHAQDSIFPWVNFVVATYMTTRSCNCRRRPMWIHTAVAWVESFHQPEFTIFFPNIWTISHFCHTIRAVCHMFRYIGMTTGMFFSSTSDTGKFSLQSSTLCESNSTWKRSVKPASSYPISPIPVSYTHLTLPTICSV